MIHAWAILLVAAGVGLAAWGVMVWPVRVVRRPELTWINCLGCQRAALVRLGERLCGSCDRERWAYAAALGGLALVLLGVAVARWGS